MTHCGIAKERSGFGGGGFGDDDPKFANPWRRDGPLPDLPNSDSSRRRFDAPREGREPPAAPVSDGISDWRSSRAPPRGPPPPENEFRRAGPPREPREPAVVGPADTEETWHIGSKFKPTGPPSGDGERPGSRFGSLRSRGEMGPPRDAPAGAPAVVEESDWRRPRTISRNSTSRTSPIAMGTLIIDTDSGCPLLQQAIRRRPLLRWAGVSSSSCPGHPPLPPRRPPLWPLPTLHTPPHALTPSVLPSKPTRLLDIVTVLTCHSRPVDVTAREAEVQQKIEKEREEVREKVAHNAHSMSRNSSRTGTQRPTPPATTVHSPTSVHSPTTPHHEPSKLPPANVRPAFSFASAAAGKKEAEAAAAAAAAAGKDDVSTITEKIDEVELESSEQ